MATHDMIVTSPSENLEKKVHLNPVFSLVPKTPFVNGGFRMEKVISSQRSIPSFDFAQDREPVERSGILQRESSHLRERQRPVEFFLRQGLKK